MKKITLSLLAVLALLVAACDNGSYELHQTFFYPQRPGGMVLYADQESDTVRLYASTRGKPARSSRGSR